MKYKIGDRVTVTGKGRTATWGDIVGTVVGIAKHSVLVRWDGTHFSDEMDYSEVKHCPKVAA